MHAVNIIIWDSKAFLYGWLIAIFALQKGKEGEVWEYSSIKMFKGQELALANQ